MINIVDSIMGSGKTNWAIQYMNEHPERRFMYITPYNREIEERIIPKCPKLSFKFAREGRKVKDFKDMLVKGQNIVATHECFKHADEEVAALLDASEYTLILDEVFEVITDIPKNKADVANILKNFAKIEDDYLIWTDETYPDEGGNDSLIKQLAKRRKVLVFDNSFFLWLFPVELFEKFSEVYIMTYLFPAQIQRHYFDLHGVEYRYFKVAEDSPEKYSLVPHDGGTCNQLSSLIEIYDGHLNAIGKRGNDLSKSWYEKPKNRMNLEKLRNNIRNFFRDISKAKAKELMWTCFKEYQEKLKGDGFASSFVECNCRATNEYGDRVFAAYCVNRFMRPMIKRYVGMDDAEEGLWALSEMLQWIWRSGIRNGGRITLYIPSSRMRELLKRWLKNDVELDYA